MGATGEDEGQEAANISPLSLPNCTSFTMASRPVDGVLRAVRMMQQSVSSSFTRNVHQFARIAHRSFAGAERGLA